MFSSVLRAHSWLHAQGLLLAMLRGHSWKFSGITPRSMFRPYSWLSSYGISRFQPAATYKVWGPTPALLPLQPTHYALPQEGEAGPTPRASRLKLVELWVNFWKLSEPKFCKVAISASVPTPSLDPIKHLWKGWSGCPFPGQCRNVRFRTVISGYPPSLTWVYTCH